MQVHNKYRNTAPADAVYIGRPSKWGNPFAISPGMDRERVIALYTNWVYTRPDIIADAKSELRGKDLICFCAPLACHGDVLMKIANE